MTGEHSICILNKGARTHFSTICRKINDSILLGNAVIYAAENNTIDVLKRMRQNEIITDVDDHIQNGILHLMDIADIYARAVSSPNEEADSKVVAEVMQKWKSIIYKVKQYGNLNGVLIITDGALIFTKTRNFQKLLLFEQSIRQNARQKKWLEVICCYSKGIINSMPLCYLVPIVRSHDHLFNMNWEQTKIEDYRILSMIEAGIDDILGKNSGKLFFRTLKLIYKIDEDRIIQNPELLDEKLEKMFGKPGKLVLQSIRKRLYEIYK